MFHNAKSFQTLLGEPFRPSSCRRMESFRGRVIADTYKMLQTTHLLGLAARNQRSRLASHLEVCQLQDLLSSNRVFSTMQFPAVVMSGRSRNEAIASPRVTNGSGSCFHAITLMQTVFTTLLMMTITMIARLNCSLQCSTTGLLRQY